MRLPKAFIKDMASSGFSENKGLGGGGVGGAQSRRLKKTPLVARDVVFSKSGA